MNKIITAVFLSTILAVDSAKAAAVPPADYVAAEAIVRKLDSLGVRFVRPTSCPEGLAGKYAPESKTLTLCPVAIQDDSLHIETLTHEAVHVAQECVNGPLVRMVPASRLDSYSKILGKLLQNKWEDVVAYTKGLSDVDRFREWEAYAYEGNPTKVSKILNAVCTSKSQL